MAAVSAARQTVDTYRQAQLRIRAQALADYMRVWPSWQGDEDSFLRMVAVTYAIVAFYRNLSAMLAVEFYDSFRRRHLASEGRQPRPFRPTPRSAIDRDLVIATLRLVGHDELRRQIDAGRPSQEAMEAALVRTSGAVTRMTLDGGRDTIVEAVREDRVAWGWARITDANPCAFCAMLASRGAVYKEETVGFQAHDQCACVAVPVFKDETETGLLPHNQRFRDMYNQAISEAEADGTLRRGTSNDLLNAFRRFYERQRRENR